MSRINKFVLIIFTMFAAIIVVFFPMSQETMFI